MAALGHLDDERVQPPLLGQRLHRPRVQTLVQVGIVLLAQQQPARRAQCLEPGSQPALRLLGVEHRERLGRGHRRRDAARCAKDGGRHQPGSARQSKRIHTRS